ncbi:LysE family translocator [Cognatiyoonia sp. IB215446]|uniref:LysE family translocator n=1 Tax=Cognatiyoonia sp. IB215446 TaxID=3097355 RepID=UPI002A0BB828|nr:LysE family translocator [Cognatiyoonia sp. IB215446]MDX8347936.1 LysE family translocator [Cognatiyoonia sp. IB215446]
MDITLLIAFITTTLFFVATPGPSVAFATAQALRHGTRGACVTVAGDALGTIVHITIAASSLTVLIALSDLILPPLQIMGGIFILYMAYQSFKAAGQGASVAASDKATFWAGFFACVSNPKAIVFFVALFPAFISTDHSILLQSIIYGAIFLVLDAVSILAYALVTMHTVRRTSSRWLRPEMLSGLGLSGVGMAMIVKGYRALPQN